MRMFVNKNSHYSRITPYLLLITLLVIVPPHMNHEGEIQVIFGPMFSGKSSELIRRVRRYSVANKSCIVIKYDKDTRYSKDKLATHDSVQYSAIPAALLASVADDINNFDVIAIDEGQFFPDVVEFSESLANKGKIVIVSALDGTFERKEFAKTLNLIPLAESVVKLTAVCMSCRSKEASFSKRLTSETQVEVIGGKDKYASVCRKCFFAEDTLSM